MRLHGPKRFHCGSGGGDVVDAEDLRATTDAGGDAGEGSGVSGEGVGEIEDLANDGFARDGEEDGAVELMECGEFAVDEEVVVALFGEVDSGVEDEVFEGEASVEGKADFFVEEGCEGFDDIGVADMGVRDFGKADAVHDEEAGLILSAESGVGGVG